jgi:hypothetical protein
MSYDEYVKTLGVQGDYDTTMAIIIAWRSRLARSISAQYISHSSSWRNIALRALYKSAFSSLARPAKEVEWISSLCSPLGFGKFDHLRRDISK